MVKDVRTTYRRRHSYRTKSNKTRVVKTPGGRFVRHYLTKATNVAKCGDTGVPLFGVRAVRSKTARRMNKNERTVSRAYGGTLSAGAVRERIMRAFIIPDVKALLDEKMRKRRR